MTFTIIGENVHATRVLSRSGRHVMAAGDREWIVFTDADGQPGRLRVPDWYRETDEHAAGRLKHVAIAIRAGMAGGPDAGDGLAYLRSLVDRQERAGAAYIDLNVDELSTRLSDQQVAIRWLVAAVSEWTVLPLSIDSSRVEIIEAGLTACRPGSRPMLNSASLERRSALDLALAVDGPVIVTAAGMRGMPQDVGDRVENATAMVDAALTAGIALGDIYIDPLIFPISVDGAFGGHALDAIRSLRGRFGPDIHVTGGMSNVSFGVPGRKLINDVFLRMAIEAGADGGIIDPVAIDLERVGSLDLDKDPYRLARNVILGADVSCRAFLRAYRAGELTPYGAPPQTCRTLPRATWAC